MKTVFLSYSHDDSEVADEICGILKGLEVSYFIDNKSIDLGASITSEVRDAITSCRLLIVVMSPASLKSHWIPYEIGHASALGKKVIPFLTHRALELPHYLNDLGNTTDLGQIRAYLKKHGNDIPIGRRNIKTQVLDDVQTEKLIRLYQGSVAYNIARVIDQNLALIKDDPDSFIPDVFLEEMYAAILKGRALCRGFVSDTLGDISSYFEGHFTDAKLRNHVEPVVHNMLQVGNSLAKRRRLFDFLEMIQEKVFMNVIHDLNTDRAQSK
jgi:hypothetical protein